MASRSTASKSIPRGAAPAVVVTSTAEREAAARLSALLLQTSHRPLRVTVGSEVGESIDLSPSLLNVLETAANMVAIGADVTVLARNEELTSQQAADFLNMSRQYMVRLLERGDIASTKVGTHRRIRAEDLANYRQRRDKGRATALADMADQAQLAGGYDAPANFGPRRAR
jgi:excisionase family DNA binding protein